MQNFNLKIKACHIYLLSCFILLAVSCRQETLEDRAERDAKEYTHKYCPTPTINHTRTDSVTFSRATHTYTYYCTFSDILDNEDIIEQNKDKISEMLAASIRENTNMKPYIQAGFHFRYVCHSDKNPQTVLLEVKF